MKVSFSRRSLVALLLCLFLLAGTLTGCSSTSPPQEESLSIVTTIFPAYDWVRTILGEKDPKELHWLTKKGVELHSYQPSPRDLVEIASCDLFIYVGGESDRWVSDALKAAPNPHRIVLNLVELLGEQAKTEEALPGMDSSSSPEEEEPDEHVWLSLTNASLFCRAIAQALSSLRPQEAERYQQNLSSYEEQLKNLDTSYRDTISKAPGKALLFGDRFPFRYLTEDYHLSYYAAFPGCSSEVQASFETIAFLAEKMDALSLPVILIMDQGEGNVAETIRENTREKNQAILSLFSMQGVNEQDVAGGCTYLSYMEDNLQVLKKALS